MNTRKRYFDNLENVNFLKEILMKLLFTFILFSIGLFGDSFQMKMIEDLLDISQTVLFESPNAVVTLSDGKVYLDQEKLYDTEDEQSKYLLLDDGNYLFIPFLFWDENGCYLSNSYEFLAKKPLKNVCNKCNHEWEKGGIVIWCPNCGSTNIRSNVPNT